MEQAEIDGKGVRLKVSTTYGKSDQNQGVIKIAFLGVQISSPRPSVFQS